MKTSLRETLLIMNLTVKESTPLSAMEKGYRDGKQAGRGTYLYQNGDIFIGNYS